MELTRKELRSCVAGMVLGDASLSRATNKHGQRLRSRSLSIAHKRASEPYLEHKTAILQPLFDYKLVVRRTMVTNQTGKTYPAVRMFTRSHPRYLAVADAVFKPLPEQKEQKRITTAVLDMLDDRGLALWWMDDGCLHTRKNPQRPGSTKEPYRVWIAIWGVYGYPLEDVELFRGYLEARFGTRWNINKHQKSGWSLRLGGLKAAPALRRMAVYLEPSMAYKFAVPS